MKLNKHHLLTGVVVCETGLRIGGTKDDMEIGGMDNPIVRHPITGLPYIPGSSLKGRMRSLLELKYDKTPQGEPCGCARENCPICRVFGPHRARDHRLGPTRLIVRDAMLTQESKDVLRQAQEEKGIYFAEIKTENWVDRLTGRAADRGLRTQERVPAGSKFNMEMVIREFEGDDINRIQGIVLEALSLVEREYLGGSGTRGYGKVSFQEVFLDGRPIAIK